MSLTLKDWENLNHLPVSSDKVKRGTVEPAKLEESTSGERAVDKRLSYRVCLPRTTAPQHFSNTGSSVVSASSLSLSNSAGVGIEFQRSPEGWPVITSLAPYGRATLSGLVEIGDVLEKVEDEEVQQKDLSYVVQKVVGPPGSRVRLTFRRTKEISEIPAAPAIVEPFRRLTVTLARTPLKEDDANSAGIGVLFHKVAYPGFDDGKDPKNPKFPVMIQALNPEGSAYKSGQVNPGDLLLHVDGQSVTGLPLTDVIRLVKGTPGSSVQLSIERGERHPIIYSHIDATGKGIAYKAPADAYYVEVVRTGAPIGIHFENYQPDASAQKPDVAIRDVHNIMSDGTGSKPKAIQSIDPESPAGKSPAYARKLLQPGLLVHAVDGISVQGDLPVADAQKLLDGPPGHPVRLLVSKKPPPPPQPPAPVEKIVEKIVEKPVEVPVEKIVYVEKKVEVPVEKPGAAGERIEVPVDRIVEKIVEREVECPVEKRVEVPVEKRVEVPVEKPGTGGGDKIVEVAVPIERIVYVQAVPQPEPIYQPQVVYYQGVDGSVQYDPAQLPPVQAPRASYERQSIQYDKQWDQPQYGTVAGGQPYASVSSLGPQAYGSFPPQSPFQQSPYPPTYTQQPGYY